MKTTNLVLRILTLVLSIGALALFFFNFANIVSDGVNVVASGATLGFGSNVKFGDTTVNLAKSSDILFCMLLTLLGALCSGLSFKFKKSRLFQVGFTLAAGIYMLVIALSNPYAFVDKRPLENVTAITYSPFVLATAILLLVAAACGVAYTLVADYIETKGQLTLPKRILRFFREYKSEIKKIVWPGPRSVVKNTLVVLIICLIVGAFIWLLDFGLGSLLDLILGL